MKFDEFDQYSEDMLLAQYEISEIINHELMKGEVREDFLKSTLESCSEPKPLFSKVQYPMAQMMLASLTSSSVDHFVIPVGWVPSALLIKMMPYV